MSQGRSASTGSAAGLVVGTELGPSQPDWSTGESFDFLPPLALPLPNQRVENPALSRGSGHEKMLPGDRGGDGVDIGVKLSPGLLIKFFAHLFGRLTQKTELATGVFEYVFDTVPTSDYRDAQSLWAMVSKAPVSLDTRMLVKIAQMTFNLGGNTAVRVGLNGAVGAGSNFSPAQPLAVAGTYPHVPILRGEAGSETDPIHVQVVSKNPLIFKVEQVAGSPTFVGSETVRMLLDSDGCPKFTPVVDDQGFDLGVQVNEEWDPIEIVFPGTAADLDLLDVNDSWTFQPPGQWTLPVYPSASVGTFQKTSAHWQFFVTREGGQEFSYSPTSGNFTFASPLQREGQGGSRYPRDFNRDTPVLMTIATEKTFRDRLMEIGHRKGENLALRSLLAGPQIAGTTFRDSLEIISPYNQVPENAMPVANVGQTSESALLRNSKPPNGAPALTAKIITTRDVDPATLLYI